MKKGGNKKDTSKFKSKGNDKKFDKKKNDNKKEKKNDHEATVLSHKETTDLDSTLSKKLMSQKKKKSKEGTNSFSSMGLNPLVLKGILNKGYR
jgi:hypothetical protein